MNNIQKGLSYYQVLLTEISERNKPVMHTKDFEVRSMEAFHYTLKVVDIVLHQKDIKLEDELLHELKQTLKIARGVKDQYLEDDETSRQNRYLATCVCNQIEGLMSLQNTGKRTSGKK